MSVLLKLTNVLGGKLLDLSQTVSLRHVKQCLEAVVS
jgi:hypothetical protein